MQKKWIVLGVVVLVLLLIAGSCASKYNKLVALDQEVKGQWAQVEVVYERRADLVPNLVETVKGAASFEKETYTAVTQARTRAVAATAGDPTSDPAKMKELQAAQDELGAQLSHLMVQVEAYPDLKATQSFRDLQAQLEGAENRINVARERFNEAAKDFNTTRDSFPTNLFAGMFGSRFQEKAYFAARAGADTPPQVKF